MPNNKPCFLASPRERNEEKSLLPFYFSTCLPATTTTISYSICQVS